MLGLIICIIVSEELTFCTTTFSELCSWFLNHGFALCWCIYEIVGSLVACIGSRKK